MRIENKIEELFELAELLLPAFLKAHKDEIGRRTGIALALSLNQGKIAGSHVRKIGELSDQKYYEGRFRAQEKIQRMYRNREISSFQSLDVSKNEHGGGIRSDNFYIAPDGLGSLLNQKFAFMLAELVGDISLSKRMRIESLSIAVL